MIYVVIATTKQRRERLQECIEAIRNSIIPHSILIYENNDGGCCLATSKALEGLEDHALVFLLNDDMIVSPSCLETLYKEWLKDPNPKNIFQPYEDIQQGRLAVSPFTTVGTLKYFLSRGYKHSFWDTEMTIMAMAYQRYKFVPEAILEHKHMIKNPDLQDETYKISQDKLAFDTELFNKRKEKQFNE
jgi:hypothetical protein